MTWLKITIQIYYSISFKLPLDKIVECENDGDGEKEDWRRVGDDHEGGGHAQEAGDPSAQNHWHRRVQHIYVLAETIQNSGSKIITWLRPYFRAVCIEISDLPNKMKN